MVARRESLIMKSSRAARRYNDGLCSRYENFFRFEIHKNRSRCFAFGVFDKFYRGGEIDYRYPLSVKNFVAKNSHYFRSRIVAASVHSLSARAAAVSGNHSSVGGFVEHNAEFVEPFDSFGSFANELSQKFGFVGEVSAAQSVDIVDGRRIVGFVGGLNSAFRHHRVGVAHTELGDYHSLCSLIVGFYCRRAACSAAPYYKHVYVVVYLVKVDIHVEHSRLTL